MAEPVVIRAEPATAQVRTAAMSTAARNEHKLVIGVDESRGSVEYHGGCSCGNWSASHHTDQEALQNAHAVHVKKKKEAASG